MTSKLGSLSFRHVESNRSIGVTSYAPYHRSWVDEEYGALSSWCVDYELEIDGAQTRKTQHGENWIQALLLAVEGLRVQFPANEENDWMTEEGIPLWGVLPRSVNSGWGYQVYKNAERAMELVTDSFVGGVERRWKNFEARDSEK